MKNFKNPSLATLLGFITLLTLVVRAPEVQAYSVGGDSPRIELQDFWQLLSSADTSLNGQSLSQVGVAPANAVITSVPTTVVGALVTAGVYPDPFTGMNLRSLPGMTYPIGKNFSTIAMDPSSPFAKTWYFRNEFDLPADWNGKNIFLHLDGLNFKANVFVNGKTLASSDQIAGMYRLFELDLSRALVPGQKNAIVIQVSAPTTNDLSSGWVDWNPAPADKNMGIHRPVYLTNSGSVSVRFSQVDTDLSLPDFQTAELTVRTDLRNSSSNNAISGELRGTIGLIQDPAHHPDADGDLITHFSYPVTLDASASKTIVLTSAQVAALKLDHPAVWWPVHLGAHPLYTLKTEFVPTGASIATDSQKVRFGVRKVTTGFTDRGSRIFKINGQNILIRGGGWAPDMLLRSSPQREKQELAYVVDLGLNTIRMEGKLETDRFFDRADELGILFMAGWSCCDHWEKWSDWSADDLPIAQASLTDQIRRLRNHPGIFVWLNGSDFHPTPAVEKAYLKIESDLGLTIPTLSHAGDDEVSTVTGHTGVKMTGPYEYVPPNYWMLDTHYRGGAFGFNTETSPGPAVPPLESMEKMLPADHRWPLDSVASFHAGSVDFAGHTFFADAINKRYGKATSLADYAAKSQLQSYETHRAMFEAFARNKYTATGVIQWMLNNAWPSTMWHLYDWYLQPGGSYYGAKAANRLLHAIYSYDDASIALVNHAYTTVPGVTVRARVFNLDLSVKFDSAKTQDVGPDSSQKILQIPTTISGLSSTYFVRLDVNGADGASVESHWYWLSTTPETLNWDALNWYMVPTKTFADYKSLAQLAPTQVQISFVGQPTPAEEGRTRYTVRVSNTGSGLGFFTRLKLNEPATHQEILPVIWEDNYITLLPGETRDLSVEVDASSLGGAWPEILAIPQPVQ